MKEWTFFLTLNCLALTAVAQTPSFSEAYWGGALSLTVMERQAVLTGQTSQTDAVTLRQRGSGNEAYYRNAGGGQTNRVALTQEGDNNRLSLTLNGGQNDYRLDQLGNANDLQLNGMRGDNVNLSVRQAGNGNGLVVADSALEGLGGTVGPIKIEQSGGMRVTVTSTYFAR